MKYIKKYVSIMALGAMVFSSSNVLASKKKSPKDKKDDSKKTLSITNNLIIKLAYQNLPVITKLEGVAEKNVSTEAISFARQGGYSILVPSMDNCNLNAISLNGLTVSLENDLNNSVSVGVVKILDAENNVLQTFTSTHGIVYSISRSEDLVALGCEDGSVEIWNKKSGALYRTLTIENNTNSSIIFLAWICHNEKQCLVSAALDGSITMWDVDAQRWVQKFSCEKEQTRVGLVQKVVESMNYNEKTKQLIVIQVSGFEKRSGIICTCFVPSKDLNYFFKNLKKMVELLEKHNNKKPNLLDDIKILFKSEFC